MPEFLAPLQEEETRNGTVSNLRFAGNRPKESSNVHRVVPIRRSESDVRRPLTSDISRHDYPSGYTSAALSSLTRCYRRITRSYCKRRLQGGGEEGAGERRSSKEEKEVREEGVGTEPSPFS